MLFFINQKTIAMKKDLINALPTPTRMEKGLDLLERLGIKSDTPENFYREMIRVKDTERDKHFKISLNTLEDIRILLRIIKKYFDLKPAKN